MTGPNRDTEVVMAALRGGCLFAGAGALELAVGSVLDVDPVWFVENDPAASRVLAHHWPGVPNYGDITTVDWDSVEPVDVLTGGFPCVDVSSAGKRAGLRPGTRSGLWSHMAYTVSKLRPKLVIIENVRGLLSADAHCDLEPCPWCLGDNEGRPLRACGAVLGDLASIGYDARWCGIRASDVGAPHGRFRVFILAWPAAADPGCGELQRWGISGVLGGEAGTGEGEGLQRERDRDPAGDGGEDATDGACVGRGEGWPESAGVVGGSDVAVGGDGVIADSDCVGPVRGGVGDHGDGGPDHRNCGEPVPDTNNAGRGPGSGVGGPAGQAVVGDGAPPVGDPDRRGGEGWGTAGLERETGPAVGLLSWGEYELAIRRWERIIGRLATAPTVTGQRGGQQLSPMFTEWMMGWPDGWVTSVPGISRSDQIKLCGNGVVPQQAAWALRYLMTAIAGM